MSQLIRLVYASRSAFGSGDTRQGLDPGVARILAKSRKNNAKLQIVGGLLFGEGFFLQCLEGEADVVQGLYRTIAADQRHGNVKVLSNAPISSRSFGAWSMKYVPGEQRLQALMQVWGQTRFDPYALSPAQIETAVRFMQSEADEFDTQPGVLDGLRSGRQPRQQPSAGEPRPSSRPTSPVAVGKVPVTAGPVGTRSLFWVLLAVICVAFSIAAILTVR